MMENIDYSSSRDMVEKVVGHMIQKSIETGMVRRGEIVLMLEDMIQSIERGTLAVSLENA